MTALSVPVDFVESVGWLLIHSLWQFAAIALLIAILLWAMRTMSATVRYWACLLALGTMAAAPAVTFLFLPPNVPAVNPVEANRFLPRRIPHETMAPAPPIVILPGPSERALPPVEAKPIGISAPPQSEMKSAASWQEFLKSAIAPWIEEFVAFWCLGVLLFALRPAVSCYTLSRMRRVGVSPIPASVARLLDRAAAKLEVRHSIRALQSTLVQVPIVAGYLRPVILLPASAMTGLTASQLEAVLLHELAHVRRHDYLVNLLQTLIETLFFYHPAVWWLSARIRHERELCCDELAAGVLGNRADYGRALLALEELRGSAPLLSLGAKGGSLLERIRRLANVETPRANRGGLVCVVFAAAVLIGVGVWSVGYAGENTEAAGKNDGEPDQPSKQIDEWGPASDGLRCRLIAVSPKSDAESPETAVPVDNFDQSDDVTFTVELKNVSGKPITLLGVRYGDSFGDAAGKLAPAVYAPHLFDFEFTDGNGRPISRPQRVFIDDALRAGSASAHEIAPGKSLTILLRPGHFNAPMDHMLKGGKYRARVRYRGPSEKAVALVKKHWPEKPHVNAWTGGAASNQVTFSVANDPARPTADELQWGEPVNGLRAAVEFQNPQDHPPQKHPPNNVPLNSKLDVIFHIQNVGDKVIHLASETWRQGDELIIKNMAGDVQTVRGIHYLGLPVMVRWTLRPGETAEIYAADLGVAADEEAMESLPDRVGNRWITEPGIYSLRYTIRSNSIQRQDDEGNVILPAANDWVGELVTGETLLNVLEPDRESKPQSEQSENNIVPNPLERKVSLVAKPMPLAEALESLCRQAGVTLDLDADELTRAELSPDTPVTVRIEHNTLENGLQRIVGTLRNGRVSFQLYDDTLYFTSTSDLQDLKTERVPQWLRPIQKIFSKTATLDWRGRVVGIHIIGPYATDEFLEQCADLPALKSLIISTSMRATSRGIAAIGRMKQLESLEIRILHIDDAGMRHVAACRNLTSLTLSSPNVTDKGLANLRNLKQLEVLNLRAASITADGLAVLAELPTLRRLQLDTGGMDDRLLEHLGTVTSLEDLSLNSGRFTAAGLAHLRTLPNLRRLDLMTHKLDSAAIEELAKFNQLEKLLFIMSATTEQIRKLQTALPATRVSGMTGGEIGDMVMPLQFQFGFP